MGFRQINSVGNGGDGLTAAGEQAASFTFIGDGTDNAFPMTGVTFVDDWQPVACSGMVGSPTISDVIAASLGSGDFTDATCGPSLTVDGFSEVGGSYALNIGTATNVDIETGGFERLQGSRWGAGGAADVIPARYVDTHPRVGFDWAHSNPSGRSHGAHLFVGAASWNYQEDLGGSPGSIIDNDFDGLPDAWETFWLGSINFSNTEDPDSDTDSNNTEFLNGTHPNVADTDGDGEPDATDTGPLDPNVPGGAL